VRRLATFVVLLGRAVIMRMHGVVMAIDGVVIVLMVRLSGPILMMTECQALPRRDRRHALDRDGEGQQKHGKKSEESFRHRRAL
jgi:hypothetical protein